MTHDAAPTEAPQQEWIGIQEAARKFQVSRNTMTAILKENGVQWMKLRSKYRWSKAEVDALYERSIGRGDE